MILDNQQQKQFLLELFNQVQFPGNLLEFAYEVKQSLINSEVKDSTTNAL